MPFHLIAWSGVNPGPSVLWQVPPVSDPLCGIANNAFITPPDLPLLIAWSSASIITHFTQVFSSITPPPVPTLEPTSNLTDALLRWYRDFDQPRELLPYRDLQAFIGNQVVAGNRQSVFAWLATADWTWPVPQYPQNQIIRAHFTGSITPQPGSWTPATFALDDRLQLGEYALIGARVIGAFCQAFRFIPPNAPLYRPGGLMASELDADGVYPFRSGFMGDWLRFYTLDLPALELIDCIDLISPGPQTFEGVLDLVRVRKEDATA